VKPVNVVVRKNQHLKKVNVVMVNVSNLLTFPLLETPVVEAIGVSPPFYKRLYNVSIKF